MQKAKGSPLAVRAVPARAIWRSVAAEAAAIAFLLIVLYFVVRPDLYSLQAAIDACTRPFCDFESFYYPMGEAVLRTGLPIQGFVYSPLSALLFAGFPPFGLRTSLVLWGILQGLCIILYLLLLRWLVPARLPILLLFVALTLSSFPVLHTLSWGQVSLFTVAAILAMLVLLRGGRRLAAAALIAIAVSFKFFPLLFLIPFVLRRDRRFVLLAAATCFAFLFVIPAIILGPANTVRFYEALLQSYWASEWVVSNYNSQYLPHVLLRLGKAAGSDLHAYLALLIGAAGVVALLNLGLIWLVLRARLPHADLWSLHILFLTIPFLLKTSWPVDLVYLPFGQALLAWWLLEGSRLNRGNPAPGEVGGQAAGKMRLTPARAASMLLLLASIVLSNIVFFYLVGDHLLYGSTGFVFWADLLLLLASYIVVLPIALRQPQLSFSPRLSVQS